MAQETKWTPGPWAVREDGFGMEVYPTYEGPPDVGEWSALAKIEDVYSEDGEELANAHLIAAAPELYEALRRAVTKLERLGSDGLSSGAYDALSKARGE